MTKSKREILLFSIISLFILIAGCSRIFKRDTLIVATSPSNPPMEMIDEGKKIIGFDIDVINQIAENSDINIKIIPVLKENLYHGLIDGSYDIAISSITLQEGMLSPESIDITFSKSYMEIGEVIIVSEDFEEYQGLPTLRNKTVGIEEGAKSKRIFTDADGIIIKEYSDIESAFEDMASGKIQAISVDLPKASRLVHLNDEYKVIFKILPEPVTVEKYVIAVKKENSELIHKINSEIEKMRRDGTIDHLIHSWFFSK